MINMKYKLLIIISIVIVIVIIIVLLLNRKGNIMIENTKSFSMFYTMGYAINSDIRYEYELKDDKYVVYVKPYGISEEDKKEFIVDKEFIEKIEEVFNKYEVYKWDGFDKVDKNVLDGDSFSITINMENNSIHASGYMSYPNNYRYVREELDNIFEELLKSN